MNRVKSITHRHPRESGGPGQLHSRINGLLQPADERFIACPWIPASAGMTTGDQHTGKPQFISGQPLMSAQRARLEGSATVPQPAESPRLRAWLSVLYDEAPEGGDIGDRVADPGDDAE